MKKTKRKYSSFIQSLETIYKGQEKHSFEEYKDPIKQYIFNYSGKSVEEVAKSLEIDASTLSKWLGERPLTLDNISKICGVLGVDLSEIILCYDNCSNKSFRVINDEKNLIIDYNKSSKDPYTEGLNSALLFNNAYNILSPFDDNLYSPWLGKHYCYFTSEASVDYTKRLKTNSKVITPDIAIGDYKELYDLYTEKNNIHTSIMHISKPIEGNFCYVTMKTLIHPEKGFFKEYTGRAIIFPSNPGLYIELKCDSPKGFMYIICDTSYPVKVAEKTELTMGMLLSVSDNPHRPYSSRIILSRNERMNKEKRYHYIIKANLLLNDSVIRIDTYGYREFVNHIKDLRNNEEKIKNEELKTVIGHLGKFIERYPSLGEFVFTHDRITKKECAFIAPDTIKQLTENDNYSDLDLIYIDSFLRLHSLSPWCAKINARKALEFSKILISQK